MADVDRARMRCGDAVERKEKAVKILEKNVAQTGSVLYRKHLASSLEKLAKAWAQSDQPAQAEACYRRAVRLREELADEYPSHTTRHELATTCFLFADHARDAGMMERALRLWEEMCHDHPEYAKYAERVRGALEGLT